MKPSAAESGSATHRFDTPQLAMLGAVAIALAAAFFTGRWSTDPADQWLQEIQQARQLVQQQQRQLDRMDGERRQDVEITSARLAELQAVSTRLDALGARLVDLAQLEEGEFDFHQAVPMGGPEEYVDGPAVASDSLDQSLQALNTRLRRQAMQLDTLESLILDRRLIDDTLPSGWPVANGWISSAFGERADPFTGRRSYHRGVDIAGPLDASVLSVGGGVVTWAGQRGGYGKLVEIDHGNGFITRYAHNAELVVSPGDQVAPGQVIATMGRSGRASSQHVHFEVIRDGKPINPWKYLQTANS